MKNITKKTNKQYTPQNRHSHNCPYSIISLNAFVFTICIIGYLTFFVIYIFAIAIYTVTIYTLSITTQLTFACLKSAIETLEKGMFKVNIKNTRATLFYTVTVYILQIITQLTFACLKQQ